MNRISHLCRQTGRAGFGGFDTHVKNIAFLMVRSGNWSLSLAFDMTYSYQLSGKWTSSHQMTMNGKQSGITLEDFKVWANRASMKRGRAETIIDEVRDVVARWRDYADESRVNPEQRDKIQAPLGLEPFT
jgi:serine/threonine-protein kinase HipA